LFEIAEITFAPKRWPLSCTIGVCPTGAQERRDTASSSATSVCE
jgi:hypothetical protein